MEEAECPLRQLCGGDSVIPLLQGGFRVHTQTGKLELRKVEGIFHHGSYSEVSHKA